MRAMAIDGHRRALRRGHHRGFHRRLCCRQNSLDGLLNDSFAFGLGAFGAVVTAILVRRHIELIDLVTRHVLSHGFNAILEGIFCTR